MDENLKSIEIKDVEEDSNFFITPLKSFAGFGYNEYEITISFNGGELPIFINPNGELTLQEMRQITLDLVVCIVGFTNQQCGGYLMILEEELHKILENRGFEHQGADDNAAK